MKSIFSVFVAVLIALSIEMPVAAAEEEGQHIRYSEFLSLVEAGQIKSVALERYSSFKGIQVVSGQEKPFRSHADTGSFDDPLLVRFLKENNVEVSFNEDKEVEFPSFTLGVGLAYLVVPIVMLVLLVLVIVINRKLNRLLKQQRIVSD